MREGRGHMLDGVIASINRLKGDEKVANTNKRLFGEFDKFITDVLKASLDQLLNLEYEDDSL